jgi:hypothetical protein
LLFRVFFILSRKFIPPLNLLPSHEERRAQIKYSIIAPFSFHKEKGFRIEIDTYAIYLSKTPYRTLGGRTGKVSEISGDIYGDK